MYFFQQQNATYILNVQLCEALVVRPSQFSCVDTVQIRVGYPIRTVAAYSYYGQNIAVTLCNWDLFDDEYYLYFYNLTDGSLIKNISSGAS